MRQLVLVDRSALYKGAPVKTLTEGLTQVRRPQQHWPHHRALPQGGGHKRTYRMVDFKRRKLDVPATVERLEYDPNRTAFIALIKYEDGELAYILAPQRLAVGDTVVAERQADVKPGNAMPLSAHAGRHDRPQCRDEARQGRRRSRARPAPTPSIVGRDGGYAILRLNSGEQRLVLPSCMATVGAVSNPDHMNISSARPAASRWLGMQAVGARRRHEPDRPSAWRRRRPHLGRPSSGHALGQADQGQEDALQQGDDQVHRLLASRQEEVRSKHRVSFSLERPVRRRVSPEEGGCRARLRPQRSHQDLEPPLHHPAAVRRADLRRLQRPEAHSGAGDRGHGRQKLGEFSPTRTFYGHAADKKAKRK